MAFENPNSELAEWVAQQQATAASKIPVEENKATPESTDELVKPVAEEAPKEQPEKPTEITNQVTEVSSWDADEIKEQPTKPVYDFSKLGSALELTEVKGEEEVVNKISELKTKLKELSESPLSGIPDEFKEVIEVAKTGDWRDYLASQIVDYSKFDPETEFENQFYKDAIANPKFQTDGKFNPQLAEQAYEAIPEYLRNQYGKDILYRKQQEQARIRQEQQQRAHNKIIEAEKNLSQAARNLQELLPFENYGIKFEPKHSSQIYEGITNSKLTKKHLGVDYQSLVRSGADMKSVARTVAAAEYAEKMVKFKADNAKSIAAKEILDKTQNAQITTPGSAPTPESQKEKKMTPEQLMEYYVKNQRKSGL